MIKHLLFITVTLFCTIEIFAQAGPTNANSYRNFIRTNGFSYGHDHNGVGEANRPVFLIEGVRALDPVAPNCLFDTLTGAGANVNVVYNTTTGMPPFDNFSSGTIKEVVNTTATTSIMDVTMMSWDHECGDTFLYDDCDFDKEAACIKINTMEGPMGLYDEQWYTIEDTARIRMQKTWRHTRGEDYTTISGARGPLTFGTIGLNEYRVHENGNRRSPEGAPDYMGYKNWWYNGRFGSDPVFTASPDVTYSFSKTQTSYAIVSLDFPETNFDTRVYVMRDLPGGPNSFGWRTEVNATNGNAVFSWPTLPAGDYFIVVEGESSLERGDFKLTVAFPETYEPGSITHDTPIVPEGCVINTPIITDVAAQTSIGTPEYKWEYKQGAETGWSDIVGATSETLSGDELGPITDSTFVRRRLSTLGGAIYSNELRFDILEKGESGHDGAIGGNVTGPNGTGSVAGVSIIVEAISSGDQLCKADTFVTLASGTYTATNLFYDGNDGEITYRITPQFEDHEFDPPFREIPINSSTTIAGQDFEDTTTVFVSGFITQKDSLDTICPLPDVSLIKDDIPVGGAISSLDGSYVLPTAPGEFDFAPDFMDGAHTFSPASYLGVEVSSDTSGFDYQSITTHQVSGSVMACGGFCYGGVEIRLVDDFGCFDYLLNTDECGDFSIELPARNYRLEVTNTDIGLVEGFDAEVIATFFSNQDTVYADLTVADTILTLAYEREPMVTLRSHTDTTGIQPIVGCETDTVLAQGELTILVFDVVEADTDGCPLDTGLMVLYDEISGRDTAYVPISNGVAKYGVIPDTPFLFPFEPYQYLKFEAMTLDSQLVSAPDSIRAIVTGFVARNSQFTTVSPEIPFLILRDPPGDESSAFFEETHTTDFNLSFSAEFGGSVTTWGQVKTGAQFEAGFLGFSTESSAWGTVGTSATVSARNVSDREVTVSVTNSLAHQTDSGENPELLYENGDIYVGAAMNIIFAKIDVLEFDTEVCQDTQVVDIIMGQGGFATEFTHTESHIRNVVIPDIEGLRDLGPPDSIVWYQDQIDMWEQILAMNADLKQRAEFVENRTFSAGTETVFTNTTSSSTTIAYEFSLEVESEFSAEAGFEVAGSGASGGVRSNFRVEIGAGTSNTELQSRVTSYTLRDGGQEPGDDFTVDIKECPVYGTPVFDLISGSTSCPYIPGTSQRDKPLLIINDPVRTDADPDGVETFFLEIYNNSEKEEERVYRLDFIDATNPNLATMNPDLAGNQFRDFSVPYTGGNSAPPEIQRIDITRNNLEFNYENLTFVVYPICDEGGAVSFDPTTASTASVSVFYASPCSDIVMSQPAEGTSWLVNDDNNNLLEVELSGYTITNLDDIEVQYVPSGANNWTTLAVVTDTELDPISTIVDLDVSSLLEGNYDIRLKLNCDGGESFTQRRSGLIDRIAPVVFGIPSPSDDVYDPSDNDEISVSFEEDITCVNASLLLTDMETLEVIPATLSCAGNQAMVVPDVLLELRDPAIYRVTLNGVEDLYGNVREDYNWVFIVGDYVFDPDCSPVAISNNNVDQDAISQSVYYSQQITSDGTVPVASTVDMRAEESIELEAGFTVNTGGVYLAEIAICPND